MTFANHYRPASPIVAGLTLLLIAEATLCGAGLWWDWLEIELLDALHAGVEVPDDEIAASDTRQGLMGLVQLGLYLACVVVFCIWVYRANANARALGARAMRFTPGWSVGWFFVPVMNLFKPFQAVKEIWLASTADDPGSGGSRAPLVEAWWMMWLVTGFASQAALRMTFRAETIEELRVASWMTAITDVLSIPLALLALLVVQGIHGRQEDLYRFLMREPQVGSAAAA